MSQPRFAPITADLLARKGAAVPSAVKQPLAWLYEAPPPPMPPPQHVEPPPQHFALEPGEKPHRIMVALSAREYETLGIAAAKKSTTRHQIARAAMDAYFGQLAQEFHDRCRCVSDAAREGGCCREI
ncbi:MAG TPA: hypothetical protein VHU87_12305 [Rhizomicrobium sp.]|jgi:hypothetical protein|nr:hypothetical protein [Rhizomicrobium sp.]